MANAGAGWRSPSTAGVDIDTTAIDKSRRKFPRSSAIFVLMCLFSGNAYFNTSLADHSAPAHWPESFGFGEPASKEVIYAWDIDVAPGGVGLPPGSGTASAGAAVYLLRCQSCHGSKGEGGSSGKLVEAIGHNKFPFATERHHQKTIGNYWPYATTIYDYINRAMPYDAPGSLDADEVYGLTAYLLFLNGITAEDFVVDQRSLPQIEMPARHRFKTDEFSVRHHPSENDKNDGKRKR